jgi:hypothetical protein
MSNRVVCGLVPALALSLLARVAAAQTGEEIAARRVLLEQAQAARSGGNHGQALDFALRAGRIQMTPSVRMFIAEEQEALGQYAASLGTSELCVREAEREPTLNNRESIIDRCRGLLATLRGRVGRVVVHVPATRPAGLRVSIGGAVLNEALYDAPSVVTPGAVIVEAVAPGAATFRQQVIVGVGGTVDVNVVLQPGTGQVDVGPGGPGDVPPAGRRIGPGPFIVMAVGVATLGASLGLFVARNGAIGNCTTGMDAVGPLLVCPTEADADRAYTAYSLNTASQVTLGVGAAVTAGGLVWLIVAATRGNGAGAGARANAALRLPRAMVNVAPAFDGGVLTVGGWL